MFDRSMRELANVAEGNLFRTGARDRKSNRVPLALPWKMRAASGVAQIAKFADDRIRWRQFLSRGATPAAPSRCQGQAQRMQPGTVIHYFPRHKIRTGQILLRRKPIVARALQLGIW